jgi:hypothetical protein
MPWPSLKGQAAIWLDVRLGVNRDGLTFRRPLPICSQLRTCRRTELSDAMGQKQSASSARESDAEGERGAAIDFMA